MTAEHVRFNIRQSFTLSEPKNRFRFTFTDKLLSCLIGVILDSELCTCVANINESQVYVYFCHIFKDYMIEINSERIFNKYLIDCFKILITGSSYFILQYVLVYQFFITCLLHIFKFNFF